MFCIRDFDCSAIRMMRCILFGVGCRAAAAAAGVIPRPLYRSPQCSDCTSHCRGAACPLRVLSALYGSIQRQEGAGAPPHYPDVSLRGAERRGNLRKALTFSPELPCYPALYCEIVTSAFGLLAMTNL